MYKHKIVFGKFPEREKISANENCVSNLMFLKKQEKINDATKVIAIQIPVRTTCFI